MRSILTLSFIGCIISATFALNDVKGDMNKRDVGQLLGPVTNGGVGSLTSVGGILGAQPESSTPQRQKRSRQKRDLLGGLPIGGLPLGGLLGSLGGGSGGAKPQSQPQSHGHGAGKGRGSHGAAANK